TDGQSVYIQAAKDAFRFVAPWGMMVFDAAGFRVTHASGAKMALGAIQGLPLGLGTYFKVRAAIGDLSVQGLATGPTGATPTNELLLSLTEIATELLVLVSKVGPAPADPAEVAAITAKLLALTAEINAS